MRVFYTLSHIVSSHPLSNAHTLGSKSGGLRWPNTVCLMHNMKHSLCPFIPYPTKHISSRPPCSLSTEHAHCHIRPLHEHNPTSPSPITWPLTTIVPCSSKIQWQWLLQLVETQYIELTVVHVCNDDPFLFLQHCRNKCRNRKLLQELLMYVLKWQYDVLNGTWNGKWRGLFRKVII